MQKSRRGLVDRGLVGAPSCFIAGRPGRLFCFGSLVVLDVACCCLWLFSLYINIKIGRKWLLNVRLAGDHLYGKLLYTGGVYDSVFLCCPFFHEMSWMRSLT